MRTPSDPVAQRVALSLLARGIGSPSEIAWLAGVSRQLVESWAKSAGIDWREARANRFSNIWSKELQRGFAVQRKVRRRRARMHPEGGSGPSRRQDEKEVADPVPDVPAQVRCLDDKE